MSRLVPGENEKIDGINRLVESSQGENIEESKRAIEALLEIFKPMILKTCKKWCSYFNDDRHSLIAWDELIGDTQYWFIVYTKDKYEIDGKATYNNFIKNHIDQRVRYLYEKELNHMNKLVFPDPNKYLDNSDDALEDVIYNYTEECGESIEDMIINAEEQKFNDNMVKSIYETIKDERYFSTREYEIFNECICKNRTHSEVGESLGISRTRVSQIVNKIRAKLRNLLTNGEVSEGWED